MDTASDRPSTFQRIRRRYETDLPPSEVILRDIRRLTAVAEAAKAALERRDDAGENVRRLYEAVVTVLKDD